MGSWLLFAVGSALFAGLTSILAKCGIRTTDSTVTTAIRTVVVLAFSWVMVFVVGSQDSIGDISGRTLLFLALSGLATGGSWLCYFKALQLGDVNKVVPIDKSSIVLTVLLAFILLGEPVAAPQIVGIIVIAVGTFLMIQKREGSASVSEEVAHAATGSGPSTLGARISALFNGRHAWLVYALLSAVFAALTSILGKVGITDVESNLGTAIRTIVVLVMAWVMVFVTRKQGELRHINGRELLFIVLSGFATGASWLCFYRALQTGPASLVVPIDKLSILVSIAFAYVVFGERLTRKSAVGLVLIVVGTLAMLL